MAKRPEVAPDVLADALKRLETQPAVDFGVLATVTGSHRQTVINAHARGELPFPVIRLGTRYVVPSAPVRRFLAGQPIEERQPA